MARKGEPRPSSKKTKLGHSLDSYIYKSKDCYDPEFDKTIRALAPQWFINTASENKKQLLEIARREGPRPLSKTKLGRSLGSYIYKTHGCYDTKFDKKIRRLAPHWFVDTARENKKQLLEIARKGEPRPTKKTKLGRTLSSYICKTHGCYDTKFNKKIRKLAPHWFRQAA